MKRNLSIWTLALLCIFGCNNSCKGENSKTIEKELGEPVIQQPQERSIKNISALYYNYIINDGQPQPLHLLQKDIPRFEVETKGILDAHITDTVKIRRINDLLGSLEPSMQQNPVDARIAIKINYTDGNEDVLCIGGRYTNRIFLNGVQQATNNRALFFLKNYIGFYPWLIGDDLFRMSEMKDNSFMKEPFVSTQHYKDYQKALVNR